MKRRDYFLIVLVLVLFGGLRIWLAPSPPKTGSLVTLFVATNSTSIATNQLVFRVQNNERHKIVCFMPDVQVKTTGGWKNFSWVKEYAVQWIEAGKSKDLYVKTPGGSNSWRLQVSYAGEQSGAKLFLSKVAFTFHEHMLPPKGFFALEGTGGQLHGTGDQSDQLFILTSQEIPK